MTKLRLDRLRRHWGFSGPFAIPLDATSHDEVQE